MAKVTKTFQVTWDEELGEDWVNAQDIYEYVLLPRTTVIRVDQVSTYGAHIEEVIPKFPSLEPGKIYVVKVSNMDPDTIEILNHQATELAKEGIRIVVLTSDMEIVGKVSTLDAAELRKELPDLCEDCGRSDCQQCD